MPGQHSIASYSYMVPTATIATTGCNAYRISEIVAIPQLKKLNYKI